MASVQKKMQSRNEDDRDERAAYLVQKLGVVPQEEAVAGVLLDHLLVMHLDPGAVPTVATRRDQVSSAAIAAAAAAGAEEAGAEAVDPEAPGQEQRVLLRVRAAADEAELPEAQLPVLRVGILLVFFLVVGGGLAIRERLDRLERRRARARRRALAGRREEVVVIRAAGKGGDVPLRAGAAHAARTVAAQTLVVGAAAAAGEVAGDGRRVVRGCWGLREVDGRGGDGDRRRVAAGRVERAEDRRGGAPHQHVVGAGHGLEQLNHW